MTKGGELSVTLKLRPDFAGSLYFGGIGTVLLSTVISSPLPNRRFPSLAALRISGGGGSDLLHGGQEQADQDGDDGDHHQQLDQREGGSLSGGSHQ